MTSAKILVVCGPTASGKSDMALRLAHQLQGEIISADSMLVYRGLDIGTDKPSLAMRSDVPHHVIDVVNPDQDYDVAQYVNEAKRALLEITSRHKIPIICGGTNYYLNALLEGLPSAPKADKQLRAEIADEIHEKGTQWLCQEVQSIDPVSAERIHPQDLRRLARVLEVHRQSGRALSSFEPTGGLSQSYTVLKVGLERDRGELEQKIRKRVEAMLAQGLKEEVEGLLARYGRLSITAEAGVGYREMIDALQNNKFFNECDIKEQIVLSTKKLVKKQLTWLKRDSTIKWFALTDLNASCVCDKIKSFWENS